jgi:hypothetical protein
VGLKHAGVGRSRRVSGRGTAFYLQKLPSEAITMSMLNQDKINPRTVCWSLPLKHEPPCHHRHGSIENNPRAGSAHWTRIGEVRASKGVEVGPEIWENRCHHPPNAGMGQAPCPCWSASVPFISPSSILEVTAARLLIHRSCLHLRHSLPLLLLLSPVAVAV